MNLRNVVLSGEEKERYLGQLDSSLRSLVSGLRQGRSSHSEDSLRAFGTQNNWAWNRLPSFSGTASGTYSCLSELADRVRQEYEWFGWKTFPVDASKNRGYFEELTISAETGLPWQFDFIELHRLKREAPKLLQGMPDYASGTRQLRELLLEDYAELADVHARAEAVHKAAVKRSFLEQLAQSELLSWESTQYSMPPRASRVMPQGVETLWNVRYITYSLATSMFHVYVLDVWQDEREPQITEKDGNTYVSQALERRLHFGEENEAWYMITAIDGAFKSIHPVHASRMTIGPFENRYLMRPDRIKPLPVTAELLKKDANAGLLRASIQYSYAPNHEAAGKEVRQVVHTEDWRDEIIVAPRGYSADVSASVLGTSVRVLEM